MSRQEMPMPGRSALITWTGSHLSFSPLKSPFLLGNEKVVGL